jgi:hypothetical protein
MAEMAFKPNEIIIYPKGNLRTMHDPLLQMDH